MFRKGLAVWVSGFPNPLIEPLNPVRVAQPRPSPSVYRSFILLISLDHLRGDSGNRYSFGNMSPPFLQGRNGDSAYARRVVHIIAASTFAWSAFWHRLHTFICVPSAFVRTYSSLMRVAAQIGQVPRPRDGRFQSARPRFVFGIDRFPFSLSVVLRCCFPSIEKAVRHMMPYQLIIFLRNAVAGDYPVRHIHFPWQPFEFNNNFSIEI